MPDEPSNTDERYAPLPIGPNSDPTGIGPPPPGAVTNVTPDGHGITRSPDPPEHEGQPGSDESRATPAA